MKIQEIKEQFNSCPLEDLPQLIEAYSADERSGVRAELVRAGKRLEALEKEKERTRALQQFERKYESAGFVCGIDEVGRGPLAGPVVAGAVILPRDCRILYLNDSKQLSAGKREALYEVIMKEAVATGIGYASPARIDEINILQATYEAMREAIGKLAVKPDILLNDAVTIHGVDIRQVPIIKGDAKSVSIAAASIIAKVTRDRLMVQYDSVFPGYGFAANKGYGAAAHIEALKRLGPTPIHRRSFIKNFMEGSNE
ncbi:ribonuclease HII [Eisenbergiella sp.]